MIGGSRDFIHFILFISSPELPILFPFTTLFRSYGDEPLRGLRERDPDIAAERLEPAHEHRCVDRGDRARDREHDARSEEHTSELQSQSNIVCRLPPEKKNHNSPTAPNSRPSIPP